MSKERKFHELIEQQNREEKDRVWAKLQQKEAERLAAQKETEGAKEETEIVLPKTNPLPWRKWAAIAASSLAVVALGVFAVAKFFPFEFNATNSSSGDCDRYFDAQAYDITETQITLKDYAQEIEKELLYFDWYAEADYLKDYVWQLKETQEVICFQEEIIDINTGCLTDIFVMKSNIRLEAFSFDERTDLETEVKGAKINWRLQADMVYANFEYEDYRYYLRVEDPADENYILTLIEELLS